MTDNEFKAKSEDTEAACCILEDLANDPEVKEPTKMILFSAFDHLMRKDFNS